METKKPQGLGDASRLATFSCWALPTCVCPGKAAGTANRGAGIRLKLGGLLPCCYFQTSVPKFGQVLSVGTQQTK